MLDIGNYFLFKPPYSESEYFIQVTDVKKNKKNGKQYVYYEHVLNEMEGNCEREPFEDGAIHLTREKIQSIISNLESEIEDLTQKKKDFKKLFSKMEETDHVKKKTETKAEKQNKTKRIETDPDPTPEEVNEKEVVPLS